RSGPPGRDRPPRSPVPPRAQQLVRVRRQQRQPAVRERELNLRARVHGIGLWRPGVPNPAAFLTGRPTEGADVPNAPAQAKLRRRGSPLVNMIADPATPASPARAAAPPGPGEGRARAAVAVAGLRIVVGSAFGEIATLVEMLDEREGDGIVSPLRFQNSVHNAAAGHLSIAHKNRTPATSLAAGNDTVAMV